VSFRIGDREVGTEVRQLLSGTLGDKEVGRVVELVTSSEALRRVGDEARGLVDAALRELESVELDGLRPVATALDVEPERREKDLRLPEIRHRETKVVERMDASTTLGFCGIFGRGAQA